MRDGSKTRQRISDEALRLFVEKGIAETSIRDIARATHVAEGALYRHYASKDDLAWRLFADQYAALGAAVDAVQAAEPGFWPSGRLYNPRDGRDFKGSLHLR